MRFAPPSGICTFPISCLHDGLQPWNVPVEAFFYVTPKDANYWVNIDDVLDLKLQAATAHVSQFDPSIRKYRAGLGTQGSGEGESRAFEPGPRRRMATSSRRIASRASVSTSSKIQRAGAAGTISACGDRT